MFLLVAIFSEVVGTSSLKMSEGLSRWLPAAAGFAFYGASLTSLSHALRHMDVSVAYAVWSGLGMVLITLIGAYTFSEPIRLLKLVSVGLIIAGVMGLNFCGSTH
jgi:small multidrug resistance pump